MPVPIPSLLNHSVIAERYFFPRPDPVPRAVRIPLGSGGWLLVHHRKAAEDGPTIVHYHGNGEAVADYIPRMADRFAKMGSGSCFVEYRGYGGSSGKPLLGDLLDDVATVHDFLGLPDARTVVFGRSVGSIFALEWIGRYPGTGGLILESAVADVRERLLMRMREEELGVEQAAFAAACRERLDHQRKLSGYARPVLLLHTAHDQLVEACNARRLRDWCPNLDSKLVLFDHGGHNTIFADNREAYLDEVAAYLQRLGFAGPAAAGC